MTHHPLPSLATAGLVLQGTVDLAGLDPVAHAALQAADIDLEPYRSLVMLGQAGRSLWERNVQRNLDAPDPFDHTSRRLVERWFSEQHPEANWLIVYPGPALLPLGQLAQSVGWGKPSPLGLSIHPTYGLWTAHRVAFLTDLEFGDSIHAQDEASHPCSTCNDMPCVTACPVTAVTLVHNFDVAACAHHRVSEATTCAHQCLARNACPIGAEFRYGDEQMHHHYSSGLNSIVRWLSDDDR